MAQFVVLFLPSALLLGAVVAGFHYVDFAIERTILEKEERARVRPAMRTIARDFASVTSDLKFLAEFGTMQRFLSEGDATSLTALAQELYTLSRNKGLYDQIRYLDVDGQERVRINYNGGSPVVVP